MQTHQPFSLNDRTKFLRAMIQVSKIVSWMESARRAASHDIQLSLNDIQFGQASELILLCRSSRACGYWGVLGVGLPFSRLRVTVVAPAVVPEGRRVLALEQLPEAVGERQFPTGAALMDSRTSRVDGVRMCRPEWTLSRGAFRNWFRCVL